MVSLIFLKTQTAIERGKAMRIFHSIFLVTLLLAVFNVHAVAKEKLTLDDLVSEESPSESSSYLTIEEMVRVSREDEVVLAIINATGDGIMWANTYADAKGVKLICPPPNLPINGPMMRDILDAYIVAEPDHKNSSRAVLGHVLMKALIHTFPC